MRKEGLRRLRRGGDTIFSCSPIGAMKLPAGSYTIKLASHDTPGLNCKVASNTFAYFLNNDWAGDLPHPWKMNVGAKSFYMNTPSDGFSVKRVSG